MRTRAMAWLSGVILLGAGPSLAPAQTVPSDFFVEDVATGFTNPVGIEFTANGWMWVVEQGGRVWITTWNAETGRYDRLPRPFLDLRDPVNGVADRGLLGFAAHPDFLQNGYVYVLYTVDPDEREPNDSENSHTYGRLERWTADPDQGLEVALPGSRVVLIGAVPSEGFPACHSSHTIGTLRFGEDGTLFAGSGDGAHFDGYDVGGRDAPCFANGPGNPGFDRAFDIGALRSQHLDVLSGKIVRIDPLTGAGLPSNPYWSGDPFDQRSKVWVLGLRNPYRFNLRPGSGVADPAVGQPGQLYIGDVGWGTWEEVNVAWPGANFGWPCYEGFAVHTGYRDLSGGACQRLINQDQNPYDATQPGNYVPPQDAFREGASSVSGTAFYTGGANYPEAYIGRLFQAEMQSNWIRTYVVDPATGDIIGNMAGFVSNAGQPVDVRRRPDTGEIYYVSMFRNNAGQGRVRRIGYSGLNSAPVIVAADPMPAAGRAPLAVQFDASASFDPDGDAISFHWDFDDGATSTEPAPLHTYRSAGPFTATLTVTDDQDPPGIRTRPFVIAVEPELLPEPFFADGTQPGELQTPLAPVSDCAGCHTDPTYGAAPYDTWSGSMMANSARDPLFQAAMTIANQDHPDGGSLCLRCHAPVGWLRGNSMPGDGSRLVPADREGVTCAFCHRLVPGDDQDPPGPLVGNGRYFLRDDAVYQGPRADSQARHEHEASAYIRSSEACAPCHSVSSPLHDYVDAAGQPLGGPTPEQRTYEEWAASAFAAEGIECQDCHMPRQEGRAGDPAQAPLRPDLARHDFAGGNAWGPLLLDAAYPGERSAAYARAWQSAMDMLQNESAVVSIEGLPAQLAAGEAFGATVRVENLTGHKLPTGYPDGRRMWLEVTASVNGAPWFASGVYDDDTATLPADAQLRTYQMKMGVAGEGESFHFLHNDTIVEDTRIPPRGFTPEAGALLPVGREYQSGGGWRWWDEAPYAIPPAPADSGVVTLRARLYYQTATRGFIEFLRDANVTDDLGQRVYDLWLATGRSEPVLMAEAFASADLVPGCAGDCGGGPVAVDDDYWVQPGATVVMAILYNDRETDGALDPRSVHIVDPPRHATVSLANGYATYRHGGAQVPFDQFTYTVSDLSGRVSNTAVVYVNVPVTADCFADADCADSNACTDDRCVDGTCVYTDRTGPCDDGVACTTGDTCIDGECRGAPDDAACDDGDPCTDDACGPSGCAHVFNTAPCDDGSECTLNDACSAGQCRGQPAPGCGFPPVANDNEYWVARGATVVMAPLYNDSDPDGTLDLRSLRIVEPPARGAISISGEYVTYRQDGGAPGMDRYTYTVDDDEGNTSNVAEVVIFIY